MQEKLNQSKTKLGFTLLEMIVLIIIVGVLAGIALPKYFSTVEHSRSSEALSSLTQIRRALERCYIQRNGTYANCTISNLDIQDPSQSVGSHFKSYNVSTQNSTGYTIIATRGTINGGDNSSTVQLTQHSSGTTLSGTGVFIGC